MRLTVMETNPQTEARAFADDLGCRASREQIVMHYHAMQADKLAIALAAKDADNARLRVVISKVCEALNNGAFCSPDCSIEFMEVVPVEVESVVSSLRSQLAEANKALDAYEAALEEAEAIFGGEYADAYGPMFELAMAARRARALLNRRTEG